MVREHTTLNSLVRRLRLSPESLAAAAALHAPGPLLQLRAERLRRDRAKSAPGRAAPAPDGHLSSAPASPCTAR
jgi:hypothetical protein